MRLDSYWRACSQLPQRGGVVGNDRWDDRFNLPGVAFRGRALAVAGSFTYVGGSLRQAGEVAVTNIAVWNGTNWSGLAGRPSNSGSYEVSALAVKGHELFVGSLPWDFGLGEST